MSNTPILDLPVAIGLDGSEWVPVVQGTGGNATTKRAQAGLFDFNGGSGGSTEAANTFDAGPVSGAPAVPTFRKIVSADLPGGVIYVTDSVYGAVGDDSTDCTSAFNAAIAAAMAAGGAIIYVPVGTYKITSALTPITTGNVYFQGEGVGSVLKFYTSTASAKMLTWQGSVSGSFTLAANAVKNAQLIYVSESVASLAAGDLFGIVQTYGNGNAAQSFFATVQSVDASTRAIRFNASLPFPLYVTAPLPPGVAAPIISKVSAVQGGGIYDLQMNGVQALANSVIGAYAVTTKDQIFENVYSSNWGGLTPTAVANGSTGLVLYQGYNNAVLNPTNINCGAYGSDALQLWYQSNAFIDGLSAINNTGFGLGVYFGSDLHVGRISAAGTTFRGVKILDTCRSTFDALEATQSNDVNIAVAGMSHDNIFGEITVATTGGPVEAPGNRNNLWFAATAAANVTVSGATQANPVVITTSSAHGLSTAAVGFFTSVGGMTQLNGNYYSITVLTSTTFSLQNEAANANVDGTGFSAYTSGGTFSWVQAPTQNIVSSLRSLVQAPLVATVSGATAAYPVVITTSAPHGFVNGNYVALASLGGMTQVNGNSYIVGAKTSTTFALTAANATGTIIAAAITNANPGRVTSNGHGLTTGNKVFANNVPGMTQLNGNIYTVTVVGANTFTLGVDTTAYGVFTGPTNPVPNFFQCVDGTGYSAYTSGGTATYTSNDFEVRFDDGAQGNIINNAFLTSTSSVLNPTNSSVMFSNGVLALKNGGTSASLTAANGGIVYSGASALGILAPTATARQMLQSGASTTPAWSTATYPATTTALQLLYSTSNNVVGELPTADYAVLAVDGSGNPTWAVNPTLGVSGSSVGSIGFQNLTSGKITLQPVTGALGTNSVLSLPAVTDTLAGFALANGGTNASLTAHNGGIVWSNATQMQITLGTATANQPLLSGATATPAWAAISYPTSATQGGIPWFSSTTAMGTSGLLAANALMIGGGSGAAPLTTTTGTGVLTALGVNTNAAGGFPVLNGSGFVAVAQGGTGAGTFTANGVLYGNTTSALSVTAAGTNGQLFLGVTSGAPQWGTMSGDATISNSGALTLASTIAAGGPTGSATVTPIITYDAKGRLTTVSSATITPAVGSITGLGTGVATALGNNVTGSGSIVLAASPTLTGTSGTITTGGLTVGASGTGASPATIWLANSTYVQVAGTSNTSQIGFQFALKDGSGVAQNAFFFANGGAGPNMQFMAPGSSNGYLSFGTNNGSNALNLGFQLDGTGGTQNIIAGGQAALATNASRGFFYIPTCAGSPSGTPTSYTGAVAMIYDTTNHQFWFYDGGWKQPKTPAAAATVTWQ